MNEIFPTASATRQSKSQHNSPRRSRNKGPKPANFNITSDAASMAEDRAQLMRSTNSLQFSGERGERETARPSSNTRHNNPQPKSFKSSVLPTGEVVHLSLHDTLDGYGRSYNQLSSSWGGRESESLSSTFRDAFKKPPVAPINTASISRYSQREQPWAQTSRASRGILPTANTHELSSLERTISTSSEVFGSGRHFHGRTAGTMRGRRAPSSVDDSDRANISTIFTEEAQKAAEEWIKNAPGFEGEVIKRMLESISQTVSRATTAANADNADLSDGDSGVLKEADESSVHRVETPKLSSVSKWGGIGTEVL